MKKIYISLLIIVSILVVFYRIGLVKKESQFISLGLSTFLTTQGGTGTTTPSGILYGDNGATGSLKTVTIGSGCTFVAGTLSCAGTGSGTFPFTSVAGYNSTSTTLGLLNGLFSTASSTFSSSLRLSSLGQGFLFTGSNGLVQSIASSSVKLSWFNNDSGFITSYTETDPIVKAINGIVKSNGAAISAVVSGTDIKTINGSSILGSGDLTVTGGNGLASSTPWTFGSLVVAKDNSSVTTIATSTIKTSQLTNDAGFITSAVTSVSGTYPIVSSGGNTPNITFSGLGTTTNSGMLQGNLYVGSGGILQTSASSSIFGYTPLNPTRALTVNGTSNQITSSAGSQDLSADRTWTLSFPTNVIFPSYASSTLGFSTPYASSTIGNIGTLTVGTLTGLLKASSGLVSTVVSGTDIKTINGSSILGSGDLVVTASAGLGTTSPWTIGNLAMVSSNTAVTSVATTSVSCSGTVSCTSFDVLGASPITITGSGGSGTSAFEIATTSDITLSGLSYFTKTSGRTTLGSVATSTLTPSAPLTGSFTQVGTGGSLGCTNASSGVTGCLTGTDWNTFNGKENVLSFTWPLVRSTNTITYAGFGTTTDTGIGNNLILYTNNAGVIKGVASSSLSLPNTALQNSTISGVSLGSNLNSLSVSGSITGTSYNGSAGVSNWALNMANANTWTALQTFTNSTTSLASFSYASTTELRVGSGQGYGYIGSNGLFGVTSTSTLASQVFAATTFAPNSIITTNGSGNLIATGTRLTTGALIATSTWGVATSTFLHALGIGTTTPGYNALFSVGTTTYTALHVNNINGKVGIGCENNSASKWSFGCGTNVNVNPNINLLVQDPSDARIGASVGDKTIALKSGSTGVTAGIYAYDYAGGIARDINLQEFGAKIGIGSSTPAYTLSVGSSNTGTIGISTTTNGTVKATNGLFWIDSSGGGSGYTTIQDEGSGLTTRSILNFTGSGVSCADDAGNTRTNCTINAGAATAGGSDQQVQFNDGTALGGAVGFVWDKTKVVLAVGTTTPFANHKMSIATSTGQNLVLLTGGNDAGISFRNMSGVLSIGTTSPTTGATSTSAAVFVTDYSSGVGKVGVGTTSPWATLSVKQTLSSLYSFVVSLSTDFVALVVDTLGRVGIGKSNPQHPLDVEGRISSQPSWNCEIPFLTQSAVTADQLGSATVAPFSCEGHMYLDVNQGGQILPLSSANELIASGTPQMQILDASASAPTGASLVFMKSPYVGSATSTGGLGIAMEATFQLPNVGTATTSVNYVPMGFSDVVVTSLTTPASYYNPTNGIMLIVSSTTNWKLVSRKAGVETIADTGLATSTAVHTALLVVDMNGANLYLNGSNTSSATIPFANLPVVNLRAIQGVGLANGTAVNQGRMRVGNTSAWIAPKK